MAPAAAVWLAEHENDLIQLRRDLHAHPELGRQEHRTTRVVEERLLAAGLSPQRFPDVPGLWCDIGPGVDADAPVVMLRADLDALPLPDVKDVPYRSTVPGIAHACGHDVHTTVTLGAGLALAAYARAHPLPGTVRLLFQPAEETMPGGALDVIDAGALKPVTAAITMHCDPALDAGMIGLRSGPITSAADAVEITLAGPGGHTSRPQNTVDLVYTLARLAVDLPAALSRRVDPRSALSLVWGLVQAGTVTNAIPRTGKLRGTIRTLSRETWEETPELLERLAEQIVAPYGAQIAIDYVRGVPPVVNNAAVVDAFGAVVDAVFGHEAATSVAQSLGGEDFGWYLTHVPGALARLGTRTPGGPTYDLHQGSFDVDEQAIGVGVRFLSTAACELLDRYTDPASMEEPLT
ncbi:amidohydrolase [Parafrankia irregularis]|uniref:Amidohydrolase n=1 Tax=Parafrankia irregularis TaxID=795642 RepID=A0A0S4QI42_9ACTN|nr:MULTISPECIES: amidohydrolase [Parafrankia]MBE3202928.1 amidohydrolase [Parafrankia sp. CH37]CUU54444.1 amidohydrolase [Parafrankia irregularis]